MKAATARGSPCSALLAADERLQLGEGLQRALVALQTQPAAATAKNPGLAQQHWELTHAAREGVHGLKITPAPL